MTRNFKQSWEKRNHLPFERMAIQRTSELEDAQKEWEVIFDAVEEGIFIHDADFNIFKANQSLARILNAKLSNLIGKRCYEAIHHLSEPPKGCLCLQAIKTNRVTHAEVMIPHLNCTFNISIYPLFNPEGVPKRFVHIINDVTAQRRIQSELLQLGKLSAIGEMVAGIAHELNNPLTSVVGYAKLLTMSEGVGDEIKSDLKKLNEEAVRVSKIVQNLLAFSRKRKNEKSYINLNEVLRNTIALKAYDFNIKNITLVEDFQTDLPGTMADTYQLQQVFLNLITNAEHAMKESGCGKLEIQTRLDSERSLIRISFKDDGPGIPEENMAKVFEPFFTTKETGTGLGLSVSYRIIQEHRGHIHAQSRLGDGATFTVELPIIELGEKIAKPDEEEEKERVSGKRVLVIDDEVTILDLVRNIFEREGMEVDTVSSGEGGLNKLRERIYDLIIMDVKMPGLDGISLYHEIENSHLELSNRILFFTGDTISSETTTFFEKIKADYIYKPFDHADFLKRVRKIMEKRT